LALGIDSLCEFLDVWVDGDVDPGRAAERVNAQLPEGFQILEAYTVPLQASSLEEGIDEVHYRVLFSDVHEKEKLLGVLSRNVEAFSSGRISIARVSKKHRDTFMDLRPFVKELALTEESPPHLHIVLCRCNDSLISISRLLETLLPPDSMDTWPYSIQKVHVKFRTYISTT
jgi:radical SAM-linked protein